MLLKLLRLLHDKRIQLVVWWILSNATLKTYFSFL